MNIKIHSLNFAITLHSIIIISFLTVSDAIKLQVYECSPNILFSDSYVEVCIESISTNRSWYRAQADCRQYGGELVSLESSKKLHDIQMQLTNLTNISLRTLFVNAHRPLYSGNDKFAWKSGETLTLTGNKELIEECVSITESRFTAIPCDRELISVPLICQRNTQRIYSNIGSIKKISHNQTKYSNETCNYLTFVSSEFNYYESKSFCETIDSELVRIPNKEECNLISKLSSPRDMLIFLDIHPFSYERNHSNTDYIFYENKWKSISELICNGDNRIHDPNNCIRIKPEGMIISTIECEYKFSRYPKGFICKQCRPNLNQKFSLNDQQVLKTDNNDKNVQTSTTASSLSLSSQVLIQSDKNNAGCNLDKYCLLLLSVILNILLILSLITLFLLLKFCNRYRVKQPNPTEAPLVFHMTQNTESARAVPSPKQTFTKDYQKGADGEDVTAGKTASERQANGYGPSHALGFPFADEDDLPPAYIDSPHESSVGLPYPSPALSKVFPSNDETRHTSGQDSRSQAAFPNSEEVTTRARSPAVRPSPPYKLSVY